MTLPAVAASSDTVTPGQRVLLRAFVALRWAGLVPLVVVITLRRETLDRAWLAVVVVAAVAGFTTWAALTLRDHPARLLAPKVCYTELALSSAVLAADGWVLGWQHTFNAPALGALWSLAAVMTTGLVFGPRWGALAGALVAAIRVLGIAAPEVDHGGPSLSDIFRDEPPRLFPTLSLLALYAVAGLGAGYLAHLQRRAEDEIASARARDEVAQTLHDGVLQTLAIFQRRVDDPILARLARDSDRDLRGFLAGIDDRGHTRLGDALRAGCDAFARRFDVTPQLLLDDDLDRLDPAAVEALAGCVAEALANVGKHASARRVVVYAGPAEQGGVIVTVKDDGCGFDVTQIPGDRGLARSIRHRVEEIGGRVEVTSRPGEGSEVRLWGP